MHWIVKDKIEALEHLTITSTGKLITTYQPKSPVDSDSVLKCNSFDFNTLAGLIFIVINEKLSENMTTVVNKCLILLKDTILWQVILNITLLTKDIIRPMLNGRTHFEEAGLSPKLTAYNKQYLSCHLHSIFWKVNVKVMFCVRVHVLCKFPFVY